MKVKVRSITSKQWEKAKQQAEQAIADIPLAHNRIRSHTYVDTLGKAISKFAKVRELEPVGKQAIWEHEHNIGSSRRYSDYIRIYEEVTIEKQSSTGIRFQHSAIRGWTDNVTIIWR